MNRIKIFLTLLSRAWSTSGRIMEEMDKTGKDSKDQPVIHLTKRVAPPTQGGRIPLPRKPGERQFMLDPEIGKDVEGFIASKFGGRVTRLPDITNDNWISPAEAKKLPPAPMPADWNCTNCHSGTFSPLIDDRYPDIPRGRLMQCKHCGRLYVIQPGNEKPKDAL